MIWPVGVIRVTEIGPSLITLNAAVVTASTGAVTLCIWPAVSVPVMGGVRSCASGASICTFGGTSLTTIRLLSGVEHIDNIFVNIIDLYNVQMVSCKSPIDVSSVWERYPICAPRESG
jgi:hypothetical protein